MWLWPDEKLNQSDPHRSKEMEFGTACNNVCLALVEFFVVTLRWLHIKSEEWNFSLTKIRDVWHSISGTRRGNTPSFDAVVFLEGFGYPIIDTILIPEGYNGTNFAHPGFHTWVTYDKLDPSGYFNDTRTHAHISHILSSRQTSSFQNI